MADHWLINLLTVYTTTTTRRPGMSHHNVPYLCGSPSDSLDHWQAEAERLKKRVHMLNEEVQKISNINFENWKELSTMTALVEKYRGQKNELLDVALDMISFIGRVADWGGPDPGDKKWRREIRRIQEDG